MRVYTFFPNDLLIPLSKQVDERCTRGRIRLASTRRCVSSSYSCRAECGGERGELVSDLGICECNNYTDPLSFCTGECTSTRPTLSIQNTEDGVHIVVRSSSGEEVEDMRLEDVFGLSTYDVASHSLQLVGHNGGRIEGSVPRTDGEAIAEIQTGTSRDGGRRRRQAEEVTTKAPTILNPLICLEEGQSILFTLSEDSNSSHYHYPVYIKDHLLNTNPDYDYGSFTLLESYLESAVNISSFVQVFTQAGVYVFEDSIDSSSQLVVVVMENGTSCDRNGNNFQVLPSSPTYLNLYGIDKTSSVNQEPDFAAIYGILATALVLMILLVLAVFIWQPKSAGIELPGSLKPKYRRLDEPKVIYVSGNPRDLDTLEKRGVAIGAPAGSTSTPRTDNIELENFNVRTLYDKLEDQTLHISAQLAQQQDDLKAFYDRISQQTEGLKSLVSEADVLSGVERSKRFQAQHPPPPPPSIVERGEPVGSETPGTSLLSPSVPPQASFTSRETELMLVLKDLLASASSGKGKSRRCAGSAGSLTLPQKWASERQRLEKAVSLDEIRAIRKCIEKEVSWLLTVHDHGFGNVIKHIG